MATKKQRLYAFWKYDGYPYILGAEVIQFFENGSVECVGYAGYAFKPVKILPLKQGAILKEKLRQLEKDRQKAKAQFDNEWDTKAQETFDEWKDMRG